MIGGVNDIFVAYGRDLKAKKSVFSLLRAYGLNPLEWEKVVSTLPHGAPFIGDVLSRAISRAGGVVIILTGDEELSLRPALRTQPKDDHRRFQPRANVIFEAGVALALQEERTMIVKIGDCEIPSDLAGRSLVLLSDDFGSRKAFGKRLQSMGYALDSNNMNWANVQIVWEH